MRMPLAVKEDEAAHPFHVAVGWLASAVVVQGGLSKLVEQSRRLGRQHGMRFDCCLGYTSGNRQDVSLSVHMNSNGCKEKT